MTILKKISSGTVDGKILNELREIKKAFQDSNREVTLKELQPFQTVNSPYYPDRAYSNPLAVQDNMEELEWKKVDSYEQRHARYVSSEEEQAKIVVVNNKKLNII